MGFGDKLLVRLFIWGIHNKATTKYCLNILVSDSLSKIDYLQMLPNIRKLWYVTIYFTMTIFPQSPI